MKIETYILYLTNRGAAEMVEGSVFGTIEEAKMRLSDDGVLIKDVQPLHEFTEAWNNTDEDRNELHEDLDCYFISYIHITKLRFI